jgi:hypothetical protein
MLAESEIQSLPPKEWMALEMYNVDIAWQALRLLLITVGKLKELCRAIRKSKFHWLCEIERKTRFESARSSTALGEIPFRNSAEILRRTANDALELLQVEDFSPEERAEVKFLRTSFSYHLADLDERLGLSELRERVEIAS